ncbi:autotransporter outer membrane beta-barrel domain-containing protein [Kordiimonas lacus]|uniref:Outer membrane autotransporter barrel domain-containing protein n=1 Tax=Kordiimonas lacus TaxID=637679 RepID=A0A1G6YG09_9PROT|nr:autotransporter outer membrane beta-barrel domain-containing protein [Kordiimonas lacus]SDD89252.1 outer membrane autotransporter barrel domain-containing protein [Kordiimonas lacus]
MLFSDRFHYVPIFSALTLVGATVSPAVFADDAEIDTDRTTAVDTTTLMGGSGTLTVTADGSVTVSSGTAVSITGNHSLLMQGTLQSDDATNAVALGVYTDDLRLTSDIDIEGAFVIDGPTDEDTATSNVGLGVFGTGVFDGNLTLSEESTISVTGGSARGILIESGFEGEIYSDAVITMTGEGSVGVEIIGDVTGDVTIDGTITARNKDSIGILQTGTIDGAFVHEGGMSIGEPTTTDDDGEVVDAVPGRAGLYVGSDITGGLMLNGEGADFNDDSDEVIPTSAITTYGGAPAVLIENLKADGTDLRLGQISGLDYGLVHRGFITVNGQSAGLDAVGMRILGGNEAKSIIEGGIHIDDGSIDVSALDATAVALHLGDGAEVPMLYNRGTIEATTGVTYNDDGNETYSVGGDAIGVDVDENALLEALQNEETIVVSAAGETGDGFGVRDQSGTLRQIDNSGAIFVVRGTNSSGETIAFDLRANTSGVEISNSGTIQGDIWLGSGDDNVVLTDGSLDGDIAFGAGQNSFSMSGNADFSGSISHEGSLDFYLSGADLMLGADDVLDVTSATLSDGATLSITVDPIEGSAGQLNATGAVAISDDVSITTRFSTFVTEEQTYTVIDAGDLTLEGDLVNDGGAFLMHSTLGLSDDGTEIELTVRPKTADELAFTGNRATLYDNLFKALDPEDDLGSALVQLEDADEVEDAMQAMMPDTTGASLQMAYSGLQQLEGGLSDRLIEVNAKKRLEGGFWAREVVGVGDMTGSVSEQGVDYIGAGILLGYDKAIGQNVLWGFGGGFMLQGTERESNIGDDVSIFSPYLNTYLIAKAGAAYATTSGSIWYNDVDRSRELSFATIDKSVDSSSSGYTAALDASIGYDLKLGGLHVRPHVGASYMHVREGGYTETGGDGANLVVESRSYSRLDGIGRVSVGYDFRWSGKGENAVIIRPEVFGTYRKALSGNDTFVTAARFESGEDWFELANDPMADKSVVIGGALNIFSGFGTASLRYSREKRDDWKSHYAGFNFQMRF